MIFYIDKECDIEFSFDADAIAKAVVEMSLDYVKCPYDIEVSLLITDNEGIRDLNRQYRNLDKPTDVLSFPLIDFAGGEEPPVDEPQPMLGDIVLSLEQAAAQAEEFGHSFEREAAFLTVHSMLHLLGYDHVNSEEEDKEMRRRQREILERMGLSVH